MSPTPISPRTITFPGGYSPWGTRGDCVFDAEAASVAVDFFPTFLQHVKTRAWAGKPFTLEPWQQDIIATLFGWKRPDGTRRYRMVYLEVARKNGKSTLGAGIGLLLLFCDREPGAEIYSAAAEREQAAIIFDVARTMVERNPSLDSRGTCYRRSIVFREQSASYKVLSSDAKTKHGFSPSGTLFDELHAQPNRDLWDALQTGTGARSQPLTAAITTAGFDRNSICWEQHNYATKVRDGIIDDLAFLPVIYAADEADEWTAPATWRKANPNMGVSVSEEFLACECAKAQESPAYENTFRRLHLNQWTEQSVRWIPMDKWDACAEPVDWAEIGTAECYGGLDLGSTLDLTAFVVLAPYHDGWAVKPYFFAPQEKARQRERKDRVPYVTWARQGFLELTPGNVTDYKYVRKRINEVAAEFNLQEIGFDPWSATQLATELKEEDGIEMVSVRQGFGSLSEPSKLFEALIVEGNLYHEGNPIMRWMASNLAARTNPAGNLKPDKDKSSDKIDGCVAIITALNRIVPRVNTTSVYAERGLLTV